MTDNFKLLESLFDSLVSKDDFYFVQILKRKKDGNELPSYTPNSRTIKNFHFFNKEELAKNEFYIKELCDSNNARAYFWINPRNTLEIACESIKQFTELIQTGNTNQGKHVYDHAVGKGRSLNYKKLWIVDIDSKDEEYQNKIKELIKECRGDSEIKLIVPTVNGVHLITTGFHREQFAQKLAINNLDNLDIHLDNPTLLYANL